MTLTSCLNQRSLKEELKKEGLQGDFSGFNILSKSSSTIAGKKIQRFRAKSKDGDTIVARKFNNFSPVEFEKYYERLIDTINQQFLQTTSPYSTEAPEIIICDQDLQPQLHNFSNVSQISKSISVYATPRGIFGICDRSKLTAKKVRVIIFCINSNKFFDLDFIVTQGQSIPRLNSFVCI